MFKQVCGLVLAALLVTTSAWADVSSSRLSLPKGPGSIEGLASAEVRPTLSTGSANYSVPIVLPPSARSFSPQISFDYNSGGGVSELGLGWGLGGVAKIVRRTNDVLPRFDETDRFGLVGLGSSSDLIEIAPGEYRPQHEDGAFLRVRRDEERDEWEVRTKSGITLRFGGADATEREGGNVASYLLREQVDLRGNKITYERQTDGGYALLQRIVWNDFSKDARNEVVVKYEERPDPSRLFLRGIAQTLRHRIKEVEVLHGSDLVRRYEVSYSKDAHPHLKGLTLVGADGKTKLPAARFGYTGAHLSLDGSSDSASLVTIAESPGRSPSEPDAQLADLNGDALPDLLIAEAGRYRSYINQDGESFDAGADWTEANSPSVSLSEQGIQLADVDGDGAIDLLAKSGTNSFRFFTQPSERAFGAVKSVATVPNISFEDPDVRLTDIDGDRRTDVIYTDASGLYVAYNQGGTNWALPALVGTIDEKEELLFSSPEVELCDINGDQLQDICVLRSGSLIYYLGRGRGRFTTDESGKNVPSFTSNAPFRHMDLNGDGWDDLVRVGTSSVFYALAIGEGHYAELQTIDDVPENAEGAHVEFADMNGSGTTDILWVNVAEGEAGSWQYLELFPEGRAGLLSRIENGLGKVQTIEYAPAARYAAEDRETGDPWTTRINVALPVVAKIQVDASLGDPLLVSEFRYRDGTYDSTERTFAAFGSGITTALGDVSTPSLQTEEHFDTGLVHRGLRGVTTFSETRDVAGDVFSRSTFGFTYTTNGRGLDGTPIDYGYQSSVLSETVEGDEAGARSTLTEIVQDQLGNVTEERNWGLVEGDDYAVGGDETITLRTYANNLEDWVLGRLASEKITDLDGHVLAAKRNYYDGNAFKGLVLGELARGELSRQEEWVGPENDDYELVTATKYDGRGLPVETRNDRGAGRVFEWSEDQTSLLAEIVVLEDAELKEEAIVDTRFGNVTTVTSYNGQTRRYIYDVLGRVTKVIEPGDSEELPTIEYRYEEAAPLSRIITLSRIISGKDGVERSESLFDGLGRRRATLTRDGDRWVVAGVQFYDARGKSNRTVDPRWASNSEYPVPDLFADENSHLTWFDALGREIETRSPEGVTTRTEYGVFEKRHWDGGQNDSDSEYEHTPVITRSDAQGHVVAHQRTLSGEVLEARYEYDLLGRLVGRRDPEKNKQRYLYDGRGRLIRVVDPDLGEHDMSYDGVGNLLSHRHPDGKTSDFSYDLTDRVLSEDWDGDGKNEVEYFYDESQGQLGRGKLLRVEEPTGFIEHQYDERGQIVQTEYAIDDESYVVQSEFDAQGRERVHVYPDGSRIELKRNERGQLNGYGDSIAIEYGGDGLETVRRFSTGVAFKNRYDQDKRRRELEITTSDGATLEHLKWNFDQGGNLLSLEDLRSDVSKNKDRSEAYAYDNLYRLIGAQGTWGTSQWKYSPSGNLLKRTSTIEAQNSPDIEYGERPHAPTSFGNATIKYDERGRMLDDGERRYEWNGVDQLTRVEKGDNWTESQYGMDGVRRIRREHTEDGTQTTHFIDGWSEVKDGKLVRYIVHAEQRIACLASDEERAKSAKSSAAFAAIDQTRGSSNKKGRLHARDGSSSGGEVSLPKRDSGLVRLLSGAPLLAVTGALLLGLFLALWRRWALLLPIFRMRLAAACVMGAALSLAACSSYDSGRGDSSEHAPGDKHGDAAVWIGELTAADTIFLTDLTSSSLGEANGIGERQTTVALLPYGFARTDTSSETNVYAANPRDRSVGLDHMGARFYAPELGIWTSGDPAILTKPEQYVTAEFGAANAYAYANLSPVVAVDRDGQFAQFLAGAAAGFLLGCAVEAAHQYLEHGKIESFGRIGAAGVGSAAGTLMTMAAPAVGLVGVATVGGASSVVGGVTTRLIQSGGKDAGTVKEVLTDAVLGTATAGVVKGGANLLRKVAPKQVVAPASSGAVGKTGTAAGVSNPVPNRVARVTPGTRSFPTLGHPSRGDVFVTAPEDIVRMNPAQISKRLSIPESDAFTVVEFATPSRIASPVLRSDPGFIGGGRTLGGAREFVIPNGPTPENATITVVRWK